MKAAHTHAIALRAESEPGNLLGPNRRATASQPGSPKETLANLDRVARAGGKELLPGRAYSPSWRRRRPTGRSTAVHRVSGALTVGRAARQRLMEYPLSR
jgi:hypothetical protein